jgi:hypothetical protein
MPPRLTLTRRIDLLKKFHNGNRVVIVAWRKMAFVFRNSVRIHNPNDNKAHGARQSPVRPFFNYLFYDLPEACPVQNHHGTFRAERPIIIAGDECRALTADPYRHSVSVIFSLQRRMAQRAFLPVHQFIRPEHFSGDGCVKLFHVLSKTSFTLSFTILRIKS